MRWNVLTLLQDLINNTYACENDKLLNDVLKGEYGFQGRECRRSGSVRPH